MLAKQQYGGTPIYEMDDDPAWSQFYFDWTVCALVQPPYRKRATPANPAEIVKRLQAAAHETHEFEFEVLKGFGARTASFSSQQFTRYPIVFARP